MSHTSNIRTNDTDVTLLATVYNTDGSVRSDLAWNTAGISIFVQRIGMANGTPLTLSNKATPATAHVDGQFLNLGGGNISVDIPDAPLANFIGQIRIYGTFAGGTIIGDWYDVVGYDATAVAVGANTTTPPTVAQIEAALVNEGDATALLQAIADKIAADLTAGDLTALAIVQAIKNDATLATMISRIDATVSSRLAATNYAAPPSAASNATAVRSELTTELARIDTNISTRLASGSYSAPPSASTIADAVWVKDISGATAGTAGGYLKDIWGRVTAAVYTMWTNLVAMITGSGATAKWTKKALEDSPTGSVYILPTKGSQGDGRTTTSEIYVATNQSYLVVRTVTDQSKALVNLSGRTLRFICESESGLDKTVLEDVDITVSGTSDATYSCKIPKTTLNRARSLSCVLRDVTNADDNTKLDSFTLVVEYAADAG